ncbi:MAG: short-chain dehydrogenase [candidate division NC10 bacterium RIFCSPLOWO2_02_FULL_66_22]|nr:MAG: short-chain dehydrogenase [candidate division NC10 bacterium RIFCSPLOWO2_02_FULL_66_22]
MAGEFDLSGKVAIVTGASRGLGQYMSRALARAGADVVITSRTLESLAQTRADIEAVGRKALPCVLDVRKLDTIQPMLDRALAQFGKIDILVNNAGCNIRKASVDVTPEDWSFVVDTILRGSFFVATAVARSAMLPQNKGRIIGVGSGTSIFGFPGIVPYCASRGGITQMTKALAAEWAPFGITVNVLAPGWFRTAQNDILFQDPEWVASVTDKIPAGRTGLPNDMDGAVVFLASDASAYVTGQLLFVDGGFTIGAMSAMSAKR